MIWMLLLFDEYWMCLKKMNDSGFLKNIDDEDEEEDEGRRWRWYKLTETNFFDEEIYLTDGGKIKGLKHEFY